MPRIHAAALLGAVLLLCQCASKSQHQPIGFAPYFPVRRMSDFSPDNLFEQRELEGTPDLSVYEKKRLLDLYTIELKMLKPGSPHYAVVASSVQRIQSEVSTIEREVKDLQEEVSHYKDPSAYVEDKPTAVFQNPGLKREYLAIYHLWNKDQNDAAMSRVAALLKNSAMKSRATNAEWMKFLNIQFRISSDTGDLSVAESAYGELRGFDGCHPDTAQAGFLYSMQLLSAGDPKRAQQVFEAQCDPDLSPSNKIKRLYWRGRFREAGGEAPALAYQELLKSRVPGYYVYLAKTRAGQKIELPQSAFGMPSYLTHELVLSPQVDKALIAAEERLKARLRKDAQVFLQKATHILRRELTTDNLIGLLYVAHLFEAAGAPLEAMRIYSVVTTELQDEKPASQAVKIDFLGEMFPRPHGPLVESLARQWTTDPDFVYAIMRQESAFNPAAVSVADARGLMQLMPSLARSISSQWSYQSYYSDKALFSAEENLKLAVFHLHQLQPLVPHVALIAASYNAGLSRVSGWWRRNGSHPLDVFIELIPINETRNYVKLVLRNFIHYKALRTGGAVELGFIPFQLPPPRFTSDERATRLSRLSTGNTRRRP